ncbi:MAG TPA: CorA family divalent cation transporter [Hyphomicrobiaceae bacterium]|nr:CorA family divalent cation transporter [Hyphomicrobiaceae bacterium]
MDDHAQAVAVETAQVATSATMPRSSRAAADKIVRHFRQTFLWPIYLLPIEGQAQVEDHCAYLLDAVRDSPWREVEDEFTGEPGEFQERHYNEFVTFLPPVQRFLYGQGRGRAVRKGYGESPIRVLRRADIAAVRVTLSAASQPIVFDIAHVDLYFFYDIDVAMLALEVMCNDITLSAAQDAMFRMGRTYPAYWDADGSAGHCPALVEWLAADGSVLSQSDYEKRNKFLAFVCEHRSPCIAAHWEFVLQPLVPHYSDDKGLLRYRLLEYYRMPMMAYLAIDNLAAVTRADSIRLALSLEPGDDLTLPFGDGQLAEFEQRYCYDRLHSSCQGQNWSGTRYMTSGHAMVVIGNAADPSFMHLERGTLGAFRHQHFLVFLIAHFHKAALLMFSDRLAAAVNRLDMRDAAAVLKFRIDTRLALETFLRFTHRYWFHEVSHHDQAQHLFNMCRQHLEVDQLYNDVREEVQDMSQYLEAEAARRQNETMMRLTVVTTFGLIGTVATGFLGMNLFSHSDESAAVRLAIFLTVFVPTLLLTFYTVAKSRRLSEFLDTLSDEKISWRKRGRALLGVWWPRNQRT